MPNSSEILASLEVISNRAIGVSVAWHVLVIACAIALARGFRPSQRVLALALVLPLASVSLVAWTFGNPFNGATFALSALALATLAYSASPEQVAPSRGWSVLVGALLLVFGLVYPHFLPEHHPIAYLYAAPLGAIPCPTLALVSGVTLMGRDVGGAKWGWVLASLGAFYAVFGLVRLGVWLDSVLLLAPVGLLLQHVGRTPFHQETMRSSSDESTVGRIRSVNPDTSR
jgi:hypothetical protein